MSYQPNTYEELLQWAKIIARSGLKLGGARGVEQIMTIALLGKELGVPLMAALQNIWVMHGSPTTSAQFSVGIAQNHPACEYLAPVEITESKAVWAGKRSGGERVEMEYTMAQAKSAGLAKGNVWRSYPRQMLSWRCGAMLARTLFADALSGIQIEDSEDSARAEEQSRALRERQTRVEIPTRSVGEQILSGDTSPIYEIKPVASGARKLWVLFRDLSKEAGMPEALEELTEAIKAVSEDEERCEMIQQAIEDLVLRHNGRTGAEKGAP